MADILTTPIVDTNNFEEWKDKFNQLLSELFGVNSEVLIASPVMLQFSQDEDATSGLDFHYRAGLLRNETQIISIPAGFVTLADNATSLVYLVNIPGSEEVTHAIVGAEPTEEFIPLYQVTTVAGAITNVIDYRTYFLKARGSAAGLPVEEYFPNLVAPQSVFTLTVTTTTYGVGVYVNGQRLAKDIDYTITGDQEITLTNPAQIGDNVLVVMRDLEGDFNFDPIEEIQVAGVGGQQIFTLTTVPASNKVAVYIQGARQFSYTADSVAGTITLDESVPEGTQVLFVVNDSAGGRAGVPVNPPEGKVLTSRSGGLNYGWEDPTPKNLVLNGQCKVALGTEKPLTDTPTQGEVDNVYADCDDPSPGNDSIVGSASNDFNGLDWNDLFYQNDTSLNLRVDFDSATNVRLNNFPNKTVIAGEFGLTNASGTKFTYSSGTPAVQVSGFWKTLSSNSGDSTQTVDLYVRKRKIEDTVNVVAGQDTVTFFAGTFPNSAGSVELLEYDDGVNPIATLVEGVDYQVNGSSRIQLTNSAFGATGQFPSNGTLRAQRLVRASDPYLAGLVSRMYGTGVADHGPQFGYMAAVRGVSGTNQILLEIVRYSAGVGTIVGTQTINFAFYEDKETVLRLEFDLNGTALTANLYEVTDIALDTTSIIGTVAVVDATYTFGLLGVAYNADSTLFTPNFGTSTSEYNTNATQPGILDNYSYQLTSRIPTQINQVVNDVFPRAIRIEDFTSAGSGDVRVFSRVFHEETIDRINGEYFASVDVYHDLGSTTGITLSVRTLNNFEDITDYLVNSTLVDTVTVDVDDQTATTLSVKGTLPANAANGLIILVEIPYNNVANKNFEVSNFQFGDGNIVYQLPPEPYDTVKNRLLDFYGIGKIDLFPYETEERGYLLCDGRAVSRTKYARLFRRIGTTFGAGDGSTTFNLPDLRGEFIRGWDADRGVDIGRDIGTSQLQQTNLDGSVSKLKTIQLFGEQTFGSRTALTTEDFYPLNPDLVSPGYETRPRNVALALYIRAQ